LLAWLPSVGRGDEWPSFRGAGGTAVSDEKQLPAEWSADKNVKWKAKLPGRGWSQPVVWGDKVFVTVASSPQDQRGRPGGGRPGGGRPGRGRPGGFGGPTAPDKLLPPNVENQLRLTDEQKKQLEALQKEADAQLAKILTEKQMKDLKEMRERGRN